jgi:hypothetical protein
MDIKQPIRTIVLSEIKTTRIPGAGIRAILERPRHKRPKYTPEQKAHRDLHKLTLCGE